ncbi:protein extra-macrochaetae [Parasteatoda tepidariorum]|uniref:protein extra-macrochaetae n=1 Tax=Parasteatoda tepidariorum TaxID=114398 RepID=UPI00077FB9E8|nr:protein extra-macrochaetae [Parasteatoda tepidariorum]
MPVSDKQMKIRRSARDVNHEEIQALLSKLKEIVPNMPRNRRLSKLEIIQYVIDYIVDLQIALECPHGISPINSSHRQPLGVISSPSNSRQDVNPLDKLPSMHRPDVMLKSISRSLSS